MIPVAPAQTPPTGPTRARLMEAVERLLAERTDLSVSLREITSAAGANVAAVNYHFGSKRQLVDAVVTQALASHADAQIAGLEMAAARPAAGVEELVWAWLQPTVDVVSGRALPITRVAARAVGGASPELRRILEETHAGARTRFADLLAERLPDVSRRELAFRLELAVSVGTRLLLGSATGEPDLEPAVADAQARWAVAFVVGGLSADPAARPSIRRRRR